MPALLPVMVAGVLSEHRLMPWKTSVPPTMPVAVIAAERRNPPPPSIRRQERGWRVGGLGNRTRLLHRRDRRGCLPATWRHMDLPDVTEGPLRSNTAPRKLDPPRKLGAADELSFVSVAAPRNQ